jgi:hypothetical protein
LELGHDLRRQLSKLRRPWRDHLLDGEPRRRLRRWLRGRLHGHAVGRCAHSAGRAAWRLRLTRNDLEISDCCGDLGRGDNRLDRLLDLLPDSLRVGAQKREIPSAALKLRDALRGRDDLHVLRPKRRRADQPIDRYPWQGMPVGVVDLIVRLEAIGQEARDVIALDVENVSVVRGFVRAILNLDGLPDGADRTTDLDERLELEGWMTIPKGDGCPWLKLGLTPTNPIRTTPNTTRLRRFIRDPPSGRAIPSKLCSR